MQYFRTGLDREKLFVKKFFSSNSFRLTFLIVLCRLSSDGTNKLKPFKEILLISSKILLSWVFKYFSHKIEILSITSLSV
jgi:hypothetical protein